MEERVFTVSTNAFTVPVYYVKTRSSCTLAAERIKGHPGTFAIDIETTPKKEYLTYPEAALYPSLGDIRLVQVLTDKALVIFDILALDDLSFLAPLVSRKWVGHHALFDYGYLLHNKLPAATPDCTLLMAKLLTHAIYPTDNISLGLKSLAKTLLQEKDIQELGASDWSRNDLTYEQLEYAAKDVLHTKALYELFLSGLEKLDLNRIYALNRNVQKPVADMHLQGMGFDKETHVTHAIKWRKELAEAKSKVLDITSLPILTNDKLADWIKDRLPASTLLTWPRTPTGKLAMDSKTLIDYTDIPIIKPFAEYKKLEKLTTTYGMSLTARTLPSTKRLHSFLRISGARTGRFSSSKPNLQNLPRGKNVREVFIPSSPGKVILCADYSQIELRVAAEVSKDPVLLEAFKKGIDLHELTASKVSGKPIGQVSKDERTLGKGLNFGLLFGLGAPSFAKYAKRSYGVQIDDVDARKAVKAFRDLYKVYYKWQKEQAARASVTHLCTTPTGKLRKLPAENTYGNSMNQPIQGGAAEAMLHALCLVAEVPSLHLINTVHDEILCEVPIEHAEKGARMLEELMLQGYLKVFPKSTITNNIVEAYYGGSWDAAKGA